MTDLMVDVPNVCPEEGCTKAFGHELDPHDREHGLGPSMESHGIAPRRGMDLFHSQDVALRLGAPTWEGVVESVDWNRVLIEAEGLHQRTLRDDRTHSRIISGVPTETCGPCIKAVLLNRNWPKDSDE